MNMARNSRDGTGPVEVVNIFRNTKTIVAPADMVAALGPRAVPYEKFPAKFGRDSVLILRDDAFDALPAAFLSEALLRGHTVFMEADCAILVGSAVRGGSVLGGFRDLPVDKIAFRRLRDRVAGMIAAEPATWNGPGDTAPSGNPAGQIALQHFAAPLDMLDLGCDCPSRGEGVGVVSQICRYETLASPSFRAWMDALHLTFRPHRKNWELAYILQGLDEAGMLQPGKRGLVFAVGTEPLPAYLASCGCEIVATDLASADLRSAIWSKSDQWAAGLASLYRADLVSEGVFQQNVSFRPVDMNDIPDDLRDFDFTWSTCSFEHCGSLELGIRFLENQMDCLKPGGVAIHTTEFNLSSDHETLAHGQTVIYRLRDIVQAIRRLRNLGHHVAPLDLRIGAHPLDLHVDAPAADFPHYTADKHLRLLVDRFACTSIGLLIRKSTDDAQRASARKMSSGKPASKGRGILAGAPLDARAIDAGPGRTPVAPGPAETLLEALRTAPAPRSPIYLGQGTVLAELFSGQPIYLDGADTCSLTPHIARGGRWETEITEHILADLAPGMHFVDIGANCGYYALLAALAVGETGSVTAIDANPRMAELMRMSASINGYDGRMHVIHAAVMDAPGTLSLVVPGKYKGSATMLREGLDFSAFHDTQEVIEVPADTLEGLIGRRRIDVMKIDAEGAEPFIYDGARSLIAENPDIRIYMEFGAQMMGEERAARLAGQCMEDGFHIRKIDYRGTGGVVDVTQRELLSGELLELYLTRR